ncbi:MAG: tetratricopeptide repeat protein [Candidatus Electrothrix sp. ATG1]|nr:tetratricopeptide repeat protein [Candidatus Electrothrix sp. ATG1]
MGYQKRDDLDKAVEMLRKSLELNEALSSKEGMAAGYANLGLIYKQRGDLDKAKGAWEKSLQLAQEMGHRNTGMMQQWLDELAQDHASEPAPPAENPR